MLSPIPPLALRYARAAYAVAVQQGAVAEHMASAQALQQVFAQHPQLVKRLGNLPGGARGRALFAAKLAAELALPRTLHNTLGVLAAANRLGLFPAVLMGIVHVHNQATGTVPVQVQAAQALTAEQTAALATLVQTHTRAKQVALTQNTKPSLMAGFKATFAGQLIDTTLRTKLTRLATHLSKATT